VARLRASGEAAGTLPAGKAGPRRYLAAAVVVAGAAIAGALLMRRAEVPAAPPAETARPVADAAPPEEAAPPRQEAAPKPSLLPPDGAPVAPRRPTASGDEITHRVLPDIPAKARNTIRGKATVVVRVAVDPAGNVTEAALESTVSSYFGRLALEAARQWRFAAVEGGGPRSWILRFQITRTATTVVPRRTGR
jgi:TonB family protein